VYAEGKPSGGSPARVAAGTARRRRRPAGCGLDGAQRSARAPRDAAGLPCSAGGERACICWRQSSSASAGKTRALVVTAHRAAEESASRPWQTCWPGGGGPGRARPSVLGWWCGGAPTH